MKQFIKRFVIILSLIVLPLLFAITTQNRVDHNTLRIEGFYQEEKNSIDVVLIGASEVFTGYSPALAYEQFGYTSYSYALDSNYTGLFISQLKEVLSHQKPKCILIETSGYSNPVDEDEKAVSLATTRKWIDGIPFSINKINSIEQLVDSDKLSYYFPFILYHGLPSNLEDAGIRFAQFFRGYTVLKGIVTTNQKAPCESLIDVSNDTSLGTMTETDTQIFLELLDYCKTLDCEVVFIRFPHRIANDTKYEQFKIQNTIADLVRQNGFEFINLDQKLEDIGLSPNQDFYGDSHLNANGQIKLTAYLGTLLQQEHGITASELSASNKEKWDKSAAYTELFYQYYSLHENDEQVYWWSEDPDLLKALDELR